MAGYAATPQRGFPGAGSLGYVQEEGEDMKSRVPLGSAPHLGGTSGHTSPGDQASLTYRRF